MEATEMISFEEQAKHFKKALRNSMTISNLMNKIKQVEQCMPKVILLGA